MEEKISNIIIDAKKEAAGVTTLQELNELKVKYLGKKSEFTAILKGLGELSSDERPRVGNIINAAKADLENLISNFEKELQNKELQQKLINEKIDVTIPSKNYNVGSIHPITKIIEDINEIFLGLGYSIEDGPEVDYAINNFDKLNTPLDHPSRDVQDTLYINDDVVLRSQTSTIQVRTMENQKPPIKMICPGRVYRADSVDASHSPVFHQIEGLVVDKDITMADLKGTLEKCFKTYLGENTKMRFRPHHFPFTEPSAEADISCFICGGKGCKVCKGEGWIELLGCGVVHPNVLENCGIDSSIYSGFAFGFGVERIAMAKYCIDDMRLLYENDIRFLKQF